MKTLMRILIVALVGLIGLTGASLAHSYKLGDIAIGHPWARATAGNATTGAAYLILTNSGNAPDRLLSASSPVAETAQLHTHLMEDGIMKMRALNGIDIDPGAPLEFKPGTLHIMLLGLKEPLKEGTRVPLTLTFQKAGTITVEIAVESAGAMTGHEGSSHNNHHP